MLIYNSNDPVRQFGGFKMEEAIKRKSSYKKQGKYEKTASSEEVYDHQEQNKEIYAFKQGVIQNSQDRFVKNFHLS